MPDSLEMFFNNVTTQISLAAIAVGLLKNWIKLVFMTIFLYIRRPKDRDRNPKTGELWYIYNAGNGKDEPTYVKWHFDLFDKYKNGVYVYKLAGKTKEGFQRYKKNRVSFQKWDSWEVWGPPKTEMNL